MVWYCVFANMRDTLGQPLIEVVRVAGEQAAAAPRVVVGLRPQQVRIHRPEDRLIRRGR